MKRKHIFRAIALILSVSLMANTIPAYALPQTTEESDGFQMPEGIPLPTEPPSLEKPSGGSGISEDELALEPPPVESEPNESPILEEVEDRREVNTKHFLTADHTYLAAVYPSAVHYEEDGVWKEIDNTLQLQSDETGSEYYGNTASDTHVRFSKYGTEDTLASIERGGLTLSWGLAGSPAQEEAAETTEEEVSADENAVSESVPDPEASSNGSAAEALEVNTGSEKTRKEADETDSYAVLGAEENAASQEAADENPASEAAEGAKVSSPEATGEEVSPDMAAAEESPSDAAVPPAEAPPSVSTFQVIQPPQAVMPLAAEEPAMLETEEEIQVYNETCTQLPALTSVGYYPEILPDIDLSYLVTSNTVKEFVTIKSVSAAGTPLSFRLAHPGLGLELTEDGRILAHPLEKPEDIAFEFSVPYMYDAAEAESYEVAYSLAAGDGSSILTLVPDQAWLADPERVYPVVIDPSTETDKRTSSIQDTFVQSKYPNQSGVSQNGSFYVGDSYPYGVSRALIRFPNLPTLSKGDMVYYAKMYVWQREFSTEGQTYFNIAAHMVTSDWDPYTVNWNNQPSFDGAALDYFRAEEVASGNTIYVTPRGVDITKAVRSWYAGSNYGIILKSVNEAPAYKEVARFFASNYPDGYASGISAEQHPGAYIYYKNAAGVEDYWSYHEQSAGRAGMGYTNDFTGNQVFIHTDTTTTGNRLPVTLSHVYNLSNSDHSSRFGNGWRLNVMQQIFETGNTEYPYKYVDGDGTEHYFYKDTKDGNKLKDEDGLGLTITNTGAESRTIETKDQYKLVFGSDSYLRQEIDPNGNEIQYTYGYHTGGNFLGHIQDPTGAGISFSYSEDMSRLTQIHDSSGRVIHFEYDAAGNLIRITDPDEAISTYSYQGNCLTSVSSPDGYTVSYEYTNDFQVPRVSKISERCGPDTGQSLKISYQNGSTTVFEDCGLDGDLSTTADNLITTYNFDNMGRVTDIYDADGNANSYEYYKENLINNKLKQSGSTQKTVYNYLINPNFAPDAADTWYTKLEGVTGGVGVVKVTDMGYIADTSLWVGKNVAGGGVGGAQQVSLPAGIYTLSGYVKTLGIWGDLADKGAYLKVITSSGIYASDRKVTEAADASVDGGWERVSVTFQLSQAETVTAWCGVFEGGGNAWFDCLQLEEGNVANRVNMARNGGFEFLLGNQMPLNWNLSGETSGQTTPGRFGSRCGTISGEAGANKNMAHGIRVTGKEGEVFSLSGWVKTDAIPGHRTALAAAVIYTNGTNKWTVLNVNPYVSGWQYVHGIVLTDDENPSTNLEYQAIHFYIFHEDQLNPAFYDGIQVTKDNGQSYVYDNKGNLVSASSAANKSGFTYDGNSNLTKISNPDGTSFEYTYDTKKNLTSAKNSEGVEYTYTYDMHGNSIQTQAQGTGEEWMLSSATYTEDGRNILTITDARGGVSTNTYDAGNRLLTAETDALGNTVNYTYDPNNDRLTQVSAANGEETITSSYSYTGDQLTSITHNGFTYTVNYDGYGNQTSTYVGSQMLSSNTYLPHNGLLSYSDYGNGGRVGYTYDKWERMVEKKYSDQAAYRYVYDAYGSLARKESLLDQTVTDYQYDMIGRIVGMDSTDGQTLRIAYDSKNRTDYVVSKVGDSSTKTRYLYGNTGANQKAGLIYGVEIDDTPAVSYAYDNMARRTGRTLDLGTDYVTSYGYLAGNEAGTTTALVERLQSGPETWWYAYDAVGNITSISKGETKEAAILQEQYVYDGLGQIIRENSKSQDKTITYRYDGGGNLTERKEYTYSTGELGDPVQTVAYGYGDMNWKDKLTSYDGTEIAYDAIGNPLSYLGKTLIWQNGRQLASLNDTDLTVNYAYDDSGIRIQKTVNETETKFYLNGTVILTQMTGNERMDFLYDEAGDLLGFKYDGNSYYYIRNLQSDITGILNSAGEQIVSYAYDAWGKLLSVAGSAADTIGKKNPFRYRGYYYDTETGLYYLNSRYYNPEIGRYLNADKAIPGVGGDIRGYNLFSYCMNNPINMSDPNGQWPKWIQGVANAVENLVKKAINKAINNVKAALSSKPKVSQTTNKRPYTGKPGSTYKAPNGDTRTYGPDGKPKHDYDHSDHGYPDKHPHDENGGHNHDWENGVRGPAYSVNNDPLAGAALITVCAIGFFLVAADDITVIGIADNFLLGPLGAGVSKGLIMIFG